MLEGIEKKGFLEKLNFLDKFLNWKYFFIIVLLFSVFSISYTNQIVLRDFPNSADEYVSMISAKLFSELRLSVPSPPHKEFFYFIHIINDGQFYGKYPPGWTFFLMLGILLKIPMIINLAFGIFALVVTYFIAKEVAPKKTAKIALLLMATSPYIIFNSASYFSHASSLFFCALPIYFYLKNLRLNKKLNWILIGIFFGISFNIRPLDAAAVGFSLFVHYLYIVIKNKKPLGSEIKNWLAFLVGFLPLIGIFLIYDYLLTGNPFVMPYNAYNSGDKMGFGEGSNSFTWAVKNNIYLRLINLNIWVPLCLLFMIVGAFSKDNYKGKGILSLVFCFIFIAYFFLAYTAGNQYGPRYIYSSAFAVFILMAIGIRRFTEKGFNGALVFVLALNVLLFLFFSSYFHNEVNQRMEIFDQVKEKGISNAIIFLNCTSWCAGGMPAGDLTRNGIHFNDPVLYVHNSNERNKALMEEFPDRKYYIWGCSWINFRYIRVFDMWASKNINCTISEIKND